jgi:citrate lyase subunit beta/citryl-CoA lyase
MRSCLILSVDDDQRLAPALAIRPEALLLRHSARGAAPDPRKMRDFIRAARAADDRPKLFAQVAPVESSRLDDELDALIGTRPDGVFLEACRGRADVQQLSARLGVKEAEAGIAAGATAIYAFVAQTPASVFALGGYAGASRRLAGLALDDAPLPGGQEMRAVARALVVLGAAAAGVPAFSVAPEASGASPAPRCRPARPAG